MMLYLLLSSILCLSYVYGTVLRCDSKLECYDDTISSDDYDAVICTGNKGCKSATITTVNTTCDGYRACHYASIENTDDDAIAYCDGYQACRFGTLEVTTLECNGDYSCPKADIEVPADGTLTCNGYGACRQNNDDYDGPILLRGDLSCDGERSCEYKKNK